MEWPHPGQNEALAGIAVSQRGQTPSGAAGTGELYESTAIVFLPAFFADSVNLKRMPRGDVVMFASDLLFEFAHFR